MSLLVLSIAAALATLAFAILIGLNADAIGKRLGLMDKPDGERKLHARATPLLGGTAVAVPVVGAAFLMQLVTDTSAPLVSAHLGWYAFAVFAMYLIGLTDDRTGLRPSTRLALSGAVLLGVLLCDPRVVVGTLQFSGDVPAATLGRFGVAFTLVCLIGLLNAVNMADGKNGLVISLSLIWTLVLMAHAPAHYWPVLAAAAVALAVMWLFNIRGLLFLGDGGSYALSAIFGLLAIAIYNSDPLGLRADHVAIMFAIPVFDTVRLITDRLRRGVSPLGGDRNHLHHLLADRWGWPPKGLTIYVALVGVPNLLAALFPDAGVAWLALAAFGYIIVLTTSQRIDPERVPAE